MDDQSFPRDFDAAIDGAPMPMAMLDAQGRCVCVNDAFVALVGWPREDILEQRIDQCVSEGRRREVQAAWRDLLQAAAIIGAALGNDQQLGAISVEPSSRLALTLVLPSTASDAHSTGLLTEREHEVLWLIADGATNAQIAFALGVAETTVQTHIGSIKRKLDATTRAHATALALRQGLLDVHLGDPSINIHQAVRDRDGRVIDTRLLYLGRALSAKQPELLHRLGQPISSWYESWTQDDAFHILREALESGKSQERARLLTKPPWASDGLSLRFLAVPLAQDRVMLRAYRLPA